VTEVVIPTPGSDLRGYLAAPEGSAPRPGVVVVFDIGGMSQDARNQADWLAGEGYLALLPDIFRGRSPIRSLPPMTRGFRARTGPMFDDLDASRVWLAGRADCTGRVGVIGFCMGGGFAMLLSAGHGFAASSINYGGRPPADALRLFRGACPIVASYGARDWTQRGAAARLDHVLTVLGIDHDVKEYPGAGHAFLNDHRGAGDPVPWYFKPLAGLPGMSYQPTAAADARRRIIAFFDRNLRGVPASAG